MKILLSPAKKMRVDTDSLAPEGLPEYIDQAADLLGCLKTKSKEELKSLWKCNDKIVRQNLERVEHMDLKNKLTPAVLSYEGIAYQYMAPAVFEMGQKIIRCSFG